MNKFLDLEGLTTFHRKIKEKFVEKQECAAARPEITW